MNSNKNNNVNIVYKSGTPISLLEKRWLRQLVWNYKDKEDKRPMKEKIFDWFGDGLLFFMGSLFGLALLFVLSRNNSITGIELSYVLGSIITFPISLNLLSRIKNKYYYKSLWVEAPVQIFKQYIAFLFGIIIVPFYLCKHK